MTIATKPLLIPQALLDHAEGVALALDMPVAWPKIHYEPETGEDGQIKPYLRIDYLPNGLRWEGLASGRIDQGLFQITVVWPPNCGILAPTYVIGQILSAFAKDTRLKSDDVTVKIDREPYDAAPISDVDKENYPITISWVA